MYAAWSTGLVLENLRLKGAAFEYLQLPFAIHDGNLGRLEIQVPSFSGCTAITSFMLAPQQRSTIEQANAHFRSPVELHPL